jgi:hypothetical protein
VENLSRNLGKTVKTYTPPKQPKNTCSWSILLLGDRGQIISLEKLKWLTILLALVFVITITSFAYLFIVFKITKQGNKTLSDSLRVSRQKIVSLIDEKDMLMVRLVMAESKIKKPVETPYEKSPDIETVSAPEDEVETVPLSEKKQPREEKDFIEKTDVKDFTITLEPDSSVFNIQFKMINIAKNHRRVSGYAFVILKYNEIDESTWFTFPRAPLVSGQPSVFEKGQYFSISYFKMMDLKAEKEIDPKQLKSATVFAFNRKGELLLKKSFPIENTGTVPG